MNETIDVLSRRLNGDVSDLVRKHESSVRAARRMLRRGRARGLTDGQIARRANFVAAISDAEQLAEQIRLERALFEQTYDSIDVRFAQLERLASRNPVRH